MILNTGKNKMNHCKHTDSVETIEFDKEKTKTEHVSFFRYSEIFGNTIQGEGFKTGTPTVWVRFWGCNFECNGFGQKNPRDPSTWELDYQNIDVTKYKSMEELPVFKTGCDSSYSWSKKFRNLSHRATAKQICDKLEEFLGNEFNPGKTFKHPNTGYYTHLAFTGGEPMLSQRAMAEILKEFKARNNEPKFITIETNGTQKLQPNSGFIEVVKDYISNGAELFWSCSPKLSSSGEKWEDAIKPQIVASYNQLSSVGQLKFVVDGSDQCWDEVKAATNAFESHGIKWPVTIMPVGSDIEGQNRVAALITEQAVKRGYHVSARVHTYVFGNVIGK